MKKIGITIHLTSEDYSLWANGIRQNIFFLARTLHRIGGYEVFIVNTNPAIPITSKLPWDTAFFRTVPLEAVKDSLDLLVMLGGEVGPTLGHYLRKRGCKVILYNCGNRYIIEMEEMLFKGGKGKLLDMSFINEIWMIPQVVDSCTHYFELTMRAPVVPIPFVWGPEFLEESAAGYPHQARYQPKPGPKRVACFEPNSNVCKFCIYDLLIAERAYRQRPELMAAMYVTNTTALKLQERFISVVQQLDIVRNGLASFEDRFPMPYFLAKFTDVVVAFQWENALNYAYLDALHLGYPLVHNAHLMPEAGYYYQGFDAQQGAEQLLYAMEHHDANREDYEKRSASVLARFHYNNPHTVATYGRLFHNLIETGSSR